MEEREEFLTARQLAKVLQVSESTVRRLARKRRIPSVRVTPKIIRFHLDAVREALDVPRSRIRHGGGQQLRETRIGSLHLEPQRLPKLPGRAGDRVLRHSA